MKSLKIRKTLLLPFSLLLLAFAANAAGLPTGYTELESISSMGTQYIDTGYTHKANTKIVCEVSVASEQPSSWAGIFGARKNSYQSNAFCFFAKCDNDVNKACYNRSGNEMRSEVAFPKGVKTTLTCEGANATWTNEYGTAGIVTTGTCDGGVNTMFVFNLNTAGSDGKRADTSPCVMTLYSFRIYEGETLVREFVPCLNDALEAGLYEMQTGEFHANQGTGEFSCDPDPRSEVRIPAHTTGVWTSGTGAKTNDVVQGQFRVLSGTENVTVVLTAMEPYYFIDMSETKTVVLGSVSADVASDDARYADCGTDAGPVKYIDANGDEKVCLDYEFVTNETSVLSDGWYVVAGTVERGGIDVAAGCTAHLILVDGASLTVQGGYRRAGIDVTSGETLVIYGQCEGTGWLSATGGEDGAGIGGGEFCAGGTVTINGGTVTAKGSDNGAGIGGGLDGAGGTVTINGGTVTATGGEDGAGIGGGDFGSGGTVTINGGTVTATGGGSGAGIGGGYYGSGGIVTINGGTARATGGSSGAGIGGGWRGAGATVMISGGAVNAVAGERAARIGPGSDGNGGDVELSGGVFAHELEDGWLADGYESFANPDQRTRADYPYAVLPVATVTVGELQHVTAVWTSGDGSETNAVDGSSFKVLKGTENVKVIITPDPAYVFASGARTSVVELDVVNEDVGPLEFPGVVHRLAEYVDENGELRTNDTFSVVTAATAQLADGWYLVEGSVERGAIDVAAGCTAHLILADGASLTVQGGENRAGVDVSSGETLVIYGQRVGTGRLSATGGEDGAGIGASFLHEAGTIRIHGGTIVATGGWGSAGIGCCYKYSGGKVAITGGRVNAIAGVWASRIGCGFGSGDCQVSISGGVFAHELEDGWLADGYESFANPDPRTRADYPYAVLPVVSVTVGEHVTAAWTSGDGSETNAIDGVTFRVLKGTENVKVILSAKDPAYVFASGARTSVVEFAVLNEDVGPQEFPEVVHRQAEYVDENGELRTNDTFSVVTAVTAQLADGWYLVEGTVERGEIDVAAGCTAHLILADGASLTVQGGYRRAGIDVTSGETLVIYGQCEGTGRLSAAGGSYGAGIGGGYSGSGGTVTINGGTVTATGGSYGAGIGGGFFASGGIVTINGGTVTATGGYEGAGIGGGWCGAGGTVTISNGAVNAVAGERAARIGPGFDGNGGDVELSGGVFAHELEDGWLADGYESFANPDPRTRADYPYAVLPGATVTVGEHMSVAWTSGDGSETNAVDGSSFKVLKGTENVKVIITPDPAYVFASGEKTSVVELDVVNEDVGPLEFPGVVHRLAEYVDENGELRTNDTFSVVTAATAQLADGWYLVEGSVERGAIDVAVGCTAHLILADSASLTVQGEKGCAGVDVRSGGTLVIYGQREGTGRLSATGGYDGAGIGGSGSCEIGTIRIHGGTIAATGGDWSAGIGCGGNGTGGKVAITGGRVSAIAGFYASCIGRGYGNGSCPVSISGGVFAHGLEDGWLAGGFVVGNNHDPLTSVDYPYAVLPGATVTVGELNHMTAAWTSGDGLKTNVIGGTTFAVEKGTENVKVIFTAQAPFCFADGAIVVEVAVGTIENDRSVAVPVVRQPTIETFGEGCYLESSGGAWIDTEYVHTSTTRVEGVMSIAEDQPSSWAAIFGARKNSYQSNAFCFFAKCDNDVNKACYNRSGNEMRSTAAFPKGVKTTLTCEGSKATWTNEYGADGIVTTGTCDGGVNTLFVFNLNTADAAGKRADTSPCAMKLYAFRICEGETLVRDFVPARTKDVRKIPGLYDRITGEFFVNCGDGDFTLGYDGPTCDGGTIEWCDAANAWVVTPTNGAAAVTVAGLPSDAKVSVPVSLAQVNGVADEQIMVRSGGYDITGAFTVSGGGIALNPNGVVTIGGETIPVKPTIGELGCFDGEPFAVGENGVAITIRTIPGLFYGFRRGSSLADGAFAVLAWAKAERTNLSFTDKSQPEQAAFYDIEVRACVEDPIPSDGSVEVKSENDPETLTIVGLNVDAANNSVLLKVGAETTANVDPTDAILNVTVRKGAEVTVKVEHAESPAGPWTELQGVGGTVTVDSAGADIEVKLTGELPAQGYFRAKVEE